MASLNSSMYIFISVNYVCSWFLVVAALMYYFLYASFVISKLIGGRCVGLYVLYAAANSNHKCFSLSKELHCN